MINKYKFWFKGTSPEGMRMKGDGFCAGMTEEEAFNHAEKVVKSLFPTIILDQIGGIKIQKRKS